MDNFLDDSCTTCPTCPSCGGCSITLDVWLGARVCESCGRVVEDSMLQEGVTFSRNGEAEREGELVLHHEGGQWSKSTAQIFSDRRMRGVMPSAQSALQRSYAKKSQALSDLSRLAAVLRMPKKLQEEAAGFLSELVGEQWGVGDWILHAEAACLFLAARRAALPLSLVEIAAASNCQLLSLQAMFLRVLRALQIALPVVEPSIFVNRALSCVPSFVNLPPDTKKQLSAHVRTLLQFSERRSLHTGRRPLPIAAAALLLASLAVKVPVSLDDICHATHAVTHTACKRYNELRASVLQFAASLPWGRDVSDATLNHHLPFLFKMVQASIGSGERNRSAVSSSNTAAGRSEIPSVAAVASSHLPSSSLQGSSAVHPSCSATVTPSVFIRGQAQPPEAALGRQGTGSVAAERDDAEGRGHDYSAEALQMAGRSEQREGAEGEETRAEGTRGSRLAADLRWKRRRASSCQRERVGDERERVQGLSVDAPAPSFAANLAATLERVQRMDAATKRIKVTSERWTSEQETLEDNSLSRLFPNCRNKREETLGDSTCISRRTEEDEMCCPTICTSAGIYESLNDVDGDENEERLTPRLDAKDIEIEGLMLKGVSREILRHGWFKVGHSLASEKGHFGSKDSSIDKLVRSNEEVEMLKRCEKFESDKP